MPKKTIYSGRYVALIRRMRERRQALGLTQAQVALRVGQSAKWLQRIESGQRRADVIETVDLLRALDIEVDEAVRLVVREEPR